MDYKKLQSITLNYEKLKSLSREDLLELIEEIRKQLHLAENADDFCIWLAEVIDVDIGPGC